MLIAVALLLIPPALPPEPGAAPDRHEVRTEPLAGGFSIEQESYARSVPIMHVATGWEKVRLIWVSPDRKVKLTVEDDGNTLTMTSEIFGPVSDQPCWSNGSLAAYSVRPPTARDWREGLAGWRQQVRGCGEPYRSILAAAAPAYAAAAADFAAAAARLRTVATERFRSTRRRCVRQDFDRSTFMPGFRCTLVYDSAAGQPPPRWVRVRL